MAGQGQEAQQEGIGASSSPHLPVFPLESLCVATNGDPAGKGDVWLSESQL